MIGTAVQDQMSTNHTVMRTVAARRGRLPESATSGSAHRMYHGTSHAVVTAAISAAHPAAVAQRFVRHE